MDILVSSNLERLLYEGSGRDGEEIKALMDGLMANGVYEVSSKVREFLKEFYGNFATEEEVHKTIKNVYEKENYLMDTHTAVGKTVWEKYKNETGDDREALIASTASPYKFSVSICNALGIDISNVDDFGVLKELNKATNVDIPRNLKGLDKKEILHNEVWDKDEMLDALLSFLK